MCFFSVNGELTIAKFDYRVVFQRLVWMGIHLVDPYQKKSAGGKHVRKFRLNLDQLIMRCNQQEKTHSLLQRDPAHARIKNTRDLSLPPFPIRENKTEIGSLIGC